MSFSFEELSVWACLNVFGQFGCFQLKKIFLTNFFFFFERVRERASRGGAEREGERIPSRLQAVQSPTTGLYLMNCEM